jgi:hypothetical protein
MQDYQNCVQWKVASLEPKSPTANVVGFTMIAVISKFIFYPESIDDV